jgi:type I restriction enzyme S subunit
LDDLRVQPETTTTVDLPEGYRDTEIGSLPEEWKVVRLADAVNEIVSGDWGAAEQANGLIAANALRGTDFNRAAQGLLTNAPVRYLKEKSIQKRQILAGDVLVELSGGSKDQPTGRILLVSQRVLQQSANPLVFSNFVKRLRVKEEAFNSTFFGYLWTSLYERGRTRIYEKRTTGIRNFKLADFLEHEYVPLPPLPEQQAIAHVLSTVQKAIETTEKVIGASRELKRSLMNHLFTYGPVPVDEAEQVSPKETEIGPVPEHWTVAHLGQLIDKGPQNGIYKPHSLYGNGTPIVRIDDFGNEGGITDFAPQRVQLATEEVEKYRLTLYDILINRVNSLSHLGKNTMVGNTTEPTVFESNMMRFSIDRSLAHPEYVSRFLSSPITKRQVKGAAKRAVAQSSINQGDVKSIVIPIPSLADQEEIVRVSGTVDRKIFVEENRKRTLEVLFKTILHNLMTGKVRVNDVDLSAVEAMV